MIITLTTSDEAFYGLDAYPITRPLATSRVNCTHSHITSFQLSPLHGQAPDPEAEQREPTCHDGGCRRCWESGGEWRQYHVVPQSPPHQHHHHHPTPLTEAGTHTRQEYSWPTDEDMNPDSGIAGSLSAVPVPVYTQSPVTMYVQWQWQLQPFSGPHKVCNTTTIKL